MNKILIYGGLGNQMFQYAFCLAQKEHDVEAEISFSDFFFKDHHNGFNLAEAFTLDFTPYQQLMFLVMTYGSWIYRNKVVSYALRRLSNWYRHRYYEVYEESREFEYDDNAMRQNNRLMIGTWQVERYFREMEGRLKDAFAFRVPRDARNRALMDDIRSCNAVSIHVRRGDYLSSEWAATHSVIRSAAYYHNALNYLETLVGDPHYFIFSDDISWAKKNLQMPNCTYIDHNVGKDSYIDLYLMSLCKHNIIANSTFSWWAAWLNRNPDKIVIMPERWLNHRSCEGIFPADWVKMPVDYVASLQQNGINT